VLFRSPLGYLLLNPSTSLQFALLVPGIVLIAELAVGTYFAVSAFQMLKALRQVSFQGADRHLAIKRVSKLILLSSCNSMINVAVLAFLAINILYVMHYPIMFLMCSAAILYCRLLDAAIQLLVLKPNAQAVCPQFTTFRGTSFK